MTKDNQNNNNNQPGHSTATFIVGVIIGAAATYLFTTDEGKKLKDKLIKEASRFFGNLGEGAQEIEEKVSEEVTQIPKHIEQIQKKGRRFFFRRSPHQMES